MIVPERERLQMNDTKSALADLKQEVADYIGRGHGPDEQGLTQLAELMTYLEETYPDDEVLRVMAFRAWTANALAPSAIYSNVPDEPGLLQAELSRVERWTLYLEGKGDADAETARSLLSGLTACFDPSTGRLEEWFVGHERQTLEELCGRYGKAPEGEPPAVFN